VSPRSRAPFIALTTLIRRRFPTVVDASAVIASGRVLVDGAPASNPAARVRADASVRITKHRPLRGTIKLRAALDAFGLDPRGTVALDVGAAAGGFTQALLDAGARRVYALDAGVGQLRGWLRADPRVVNLEGTNLGSLRGWARTMLPEPVDLVTLDLSYLAVADALPQLDRALLAPEAHLVALVKPTYELHSAALAADQARVDQAVGVATHAMRLEGWDVSSTVPSSVRGARGAVEVFVSARLRRPLARPASGGW
jgi:23S rRNA (cytidine1920-2'-O)/16S rRNA (cytidine1409-2'-O)-methyltransferase